MPPDCGLPGFVVNVFPCEEIDWIGREQAVYPGRSVGSILACCRDVDDGPLYGLTQ